MRVLEDTMVGVFGGITPKQPPRQGETFVYIPARHNSSRVKDKNIADVCGHPLMAYTIRMALALDGVDAVYVDTDCERYADIAREYGAQVPFLRDPALAGDTSSLSAASERFCARLKERGANLTRQITMMVTSPFRNIHALNKMVADLSRYVGVKTVNVVDMRPHDIFLEKDDGLQPLLPLLSHSVDQFEWIKELGYFHGVNRDDATMATWNYYDNFKYAVISNPIEMVDVDEAEDLDLVRTIVRGKLYDFGVELS